MNDGIQEYAGFWRRFAACFIDGAVVVFATGRSIELSQISRMFDPHSGVSLLGSMGLASLLVPLFAWAYFSGMESSPLQATIGKLAVGLYVTDLQGQRISFSKATGRYFAKILSGLTLSIGYIMAGFTKRKQALHDMMARCLVMGK